MAEAVSLIFSEPEATGEFVVPERDLDADRNYPEITAQELPYGDGKTIVLDSELRIASINSGNITTITKTPPPEPVDEIIRLTKDRTIVDELVARGVTPEASQSLAAALEPVYPGKRFKEGAEFELTLEQQQDFYGRYVIFPVQLAFRPGPKENDHRRSRRGWTFRSPYRGRSGRQDLALRGLRPLPHQGACRLEPLCDRQG